MKNVFSEHKMVSTVQETFSIKVCQLPQSNGMMMGTNSHHCTVWKCQQRYAMHRPSVYNILNNSILLNLETQHFYVRPSSPDFKIIDSCTRQFPEFAERARKRIRTYLKSCRRNKRSRETNGAWDAVRIVRIKTETASLHSQILTCRTHLVFP